MRVGKFQLIVSHNLVNIDVNLGMYKMSIPTLIGVKMLIDGGFVGMQTQTLVTYLIRAVLPKIIDLGSNPS